MIPSSWLVEFHRQWRRARKNRTEASRRGFSRSWEALLDDAKLVSSEDRNYAEQELRKLTAQGRLTLHMQRGSKRWIEKITLPPHQEPWLLSLFGQTAAADLQGQSLAIIAEFLKREHPRYPDLWQQWCLRLQAAFLVTRSLRPLLWNQPDRLRQLLEVTHGLTSEAWEAGSLIREVSKQVGLGSKDLEDYRRTFEACLHQLFRTATPLGALGIQVSDATLRAAGPLALHFPDGAVQDFGALESHYSVSFRDLDRAVSVVTTADRLLTIENEKTTFRQLAALNRDDRTLIVSASYPTPALRLFLQKLPLTLPHFHFGDTDPAGWEILAQLSEVTSRPVSPWRMRWRPAARKEMLAKHHRLLLGRLMERDTLKNVKPELQKMLMEDDLGDYEQESIRLSKELTGWPFGTDEHVP